MGAGVRSREGIVLVTHTDLDGMASAVAYLMLEGNMPGNWFNAKENVEGAPAEIHFAEPHNLAQLLEDFIKTGKDVKKLVITDLGLNRDTFEKILASLKRLIDKGARIEWYDHHKWDREWKERLEDIGVILHVEHDTCAAGVVSRHAGSSDVSKEYHECLNTLVKATCAADIWLWDHPLAPLLYRVTATPRGPKGDAARRAIIERFINCRIWDDAWMEKIEEHVDKELEGYVRAKKDARLAEVLDNVKLVVLLKKKHHPPTSFVASFLLKRSRADLAAIVRIDGAVSLRSKNVDVRKIAVCMGGGGHPRASGAKVRLPLYMKVLRYIIPPVYSRILVSKVIRTIKDCYNKGNSIVGDGGHGQQGQ